MSVGWIFFFQRFLRFLECIGSSEASEAVWQTVFVFFPPFELF
jgi:hypothetical protein